MIAIISSLILRYHVKPEEIYFLDRENQISDGSFEDFNQTVGDCCNSNPGVGEVSAIKSENSYDGKYALELVSKNHCACIGKTVAKIFSREKYLLSFNYKGDNARICVWVTEDNQCLASNNFEQSSPWRSFKKIINFTEKSRKADIFFYADSDGRVTTINRYDNLQFHKLTEVDLSYSFDSYEKYIIKTDSSNVVHNGEPLDEESGYYLVTGKPDITLRFPWPELILLLFMMLVVIRLLFKRQDVKQERTNR